ncbi:hypothetical protein OAG71_02245 [bacterium]|nr:hypothetical protein [bacterium]
MASPWASGPREILTHGLSLLHTDSDANRRLALLSIDNAVELTLKTFLGLPKRVSGLSLTRREYADMSESFPKLLDAIETHADDRLQGINLGEIEWFHRLRNQLYHQGNGLTVDRDKVEIYSELAKLLFENLFAETLAVAPEDDHATLGAFLAAWVDFERTLGELAEKHKEDLSTLHNRTRPPLMVVRELISIGVFAPEDAHDIDSLRKTRNEVVHGIVDYNTAVTDEIIQKLRDITAKYKPE